MELRWQPARANFDDAFYGFAGEYLVGQVLETVDSEGRTRWQGYVHHRPVGPRCLTRKAATAEVAAAVASVPPARAARAWPSAG